ncbi:MAG TPA: hypothetical protein VK324_01315 [Tepidisphaeraceae bacterium]|nr:hypothetical protein [Tepidisphaeraceae bacterium]
MRRQLVSLVALVMVAGSMASAQEAGEQAALLSADASKMGDFDVTFKDGKKTEDSKGDLPQPWSMNTWNAGATIQAVLAEEPTTKTKAVAIRCLDASGVQFYNWKQVPLTAGRQYEASIEYFAGPGAGGNFSAFGEKVPEQKVDLSGDKKEFATEKLVINQKEDGMLNVRIQSFGTGADKGIWFKSIKVVEVGEAK